MVSSTKLDINLNKTKIIKKPIGNKTQEENMHFLVKIFNIFISTVLNNINNIANYNKDSIKYGLCEITTKNKLVKIIEDINKISIEKIDEKIQYLNNLLKNINSNKSFSENFEFNLEDINNIIEDFFENLIFKEIIDENTKTTILNRQEFLFTNYNILFNLIKNKLQIFEDINKDLNLIIENGEKYSLYVKTNILEVHENLYKKNLKNEVLKKINSETFLTHKNFEVIKNSNNSTTILFG